MTIEEAIKHCKEVARKNIDAECSDKCMNDHLQLAEWLEELKRLRAENTELRRDLGTFI